MIDIITRSNTEFEDELDNISRYSCDIIAKHSKRALSINYDVENDEDAPEEVMEISLDSLRSNMIEHAITVHHEKSISLLETLIDINHKDDDELIEMISQDRTIYLYLINPSEELTAFYKLRYEL